MLEHTAIILTRNRPALAWDLVQYLRLTLGWTCPILMVDQSDDGGAQLLALLSTDPAAARGVQHIRHDQRGISAGRNEGARHAHTPWFLFLDDDCRPAADYLEELTRFIHSNPWVDAVTRKYLSQSDWQEYLQGPEQWRQRFDAERGLRPPQAPSPRFFLATSLAAHEKLTIGVTGGNLAVRSQAFWGVGAFDEHFAGAHDDSDFGVRLWWYGYRAAICPTAIMFHLKAPYGGSRELKLDPGIFYLYFKWFPGARSWMMILTECLSVIRQRPFQIVRLTVNNVGCILQARKFARQGPIYASAPTPRCQLASQPVPGESTDGR